MRSPYSRTAKLFILALTLTFGFLLTGGLKPAMAQTNADTISTAGVQFTPVTADTATAVDTASVQTAKPTAIKTVGEVAVKETEKPKTLWQIFIIGFISGLGALVMPCLYPLLPLTVSFFTKLGGSKAKAIGYSAIYGLSIIVVYVGLGLALSIYFGPDTMNAIATSGAFNLIVFIMLVIFGISFLGAFEINLPNSLVNKIDAQSDRGGLIGVFFMALTLVVVSFSCTGGVVAGNLANAFSKGERLGPGISMLGFSLALAIPFTLFALFPSALKSLPKSGGWLNSVKVVLGFLEMALALKFLSNVDLAYHWNWLDREVFLSLWIAIGILTVLYLLGKIKFSHDSDMPYLSVTRVMFALGILSFVVYMVPGLWGAPLKSISAYLPPPATQDFDLTNLRTAGPSAVNSGTSVTEKKYEELFKRGKHKGLDEWYDLEQALKVSKESNKPILIDFTGWNCANCRKMENDVWSDLRVHALLQNDYILLELYVDEKGELSKADQYVSKYSKKLIQSIGAKNSDYEASKFNVNSQPYYVIMNAKGDVLVPPQGANYNIDNYIQFLESGKAAYTKNNGRN